jgi:hypothetical protein
MKSRRGSTRSRIAETATEKEQRLQAERQVRKLTTDVEQLNAQLRRAFYNFPTR